MQNIGIDFRIGKVTTRKKTRQIKPLEMVEKRQQIMTIQNMKKNIKIEN